MEELEIEARDGRRLAAVLIRPQHPSRAVLFSPGTAVRKEQYIHFARYGAERGAAVLLYDYRSQGASTARSVKNDRADFLDWGQLDFPAALDMLHRSFPDLPLTTMGHSAGGLILGLADNHVLAERHIFLAACWPYWKDKPLKFSSQELFLWLAYGPVCNKLFGYIPKGGLWKGESVNPKLFSTWKRWCMSPSPVEFAQEQYRQVTSPIRAFCFNDDPIATRSNVSKLLDAFEQAPHDQVWLNPQDFGLTKLGHQGIFSRRSRNAWAPIWDWALQEVPGSQDAPTSDPAISQQRTSADAPATARATVEPGSPVNGASA